MEKKLNEQKTVIFSRSGNQPSINANLFFSFIDRNVFEMTAKNLLLSHFGLNV